MLTPELARQRYWKKTLTLVIGLLVLWFVSSLGCGVLFVDQLDRFMLPGTGIKLGFWFAQQGSILVFLAILAVFMKIMNGLDKELATEVESTEKNK